MILNRVRMKRLTLYYVIPSILLLYTLSMVMIQFGIPNTRMPLNDLEEPLDLDMEGLYAGQRLIFQYRTGKSEFSESIKIHDLDEKLDSEQETGHSAKRKSEFRKVGSINVFSVYLDNRIPKSNVITIISLKKSMDTDGIICHFHIKNGSYIKITSRSYEMCENHGRTYGGWMYFCSIPSNVLREHSKRNRTLSYVSLSNTKNQTSLIKFKITGLTHPTKNQTVNQKSLGVCIPPLFGDISISLLVQFIELSKILGVDHFIFYNHEISESIYKLLRFYHMREEATIINWKLPEQIMDREIWYHGQLLAIQDCLYRNMATTKLLAFLDIDEFIIPSTNESLPYIINSIINTTDNSDTIAAFSFRSAFFAPNQILDTSQQLSFLQILQRTEQLSEKRTKLIVQPQKVIELGIHHVSKSIADNLIVSPVNSSLAKIHHYRACVINFEPEMNCLKETRDDRVLKYSTDLVKNYKNVLKKTLPLFMPKQKWT